MKVSLKVVALIMGPLLFLIINQIAPTAGLDENAWDVLAVVSWMVIWWIFEAVPIPVTALLPIILMPLLGVSSVGEATSPYASSIIFLFMGGFMLALGMERHNLHKRIALNLIRLTGTNANGVILGFMLATAILSMWISNTATAVMMLPIALSVVTLLDTEQSETKKGFSKFKLGLFLSIAYAANIGGMGTLIGTPPNVVFLGYVNTMLKSDIAFADWLLFGIPAVAILLFLTYVLITRVLFPHKLGKIKGADELIHKELHALGKWKQAERAVAVIFACTALAWIFKKQINLLIGQDLLTDTITAMMGGLAMFVVPVNKKGKRLLKWEATRDLPWGILILFGGGMSLAKAMERTGIVELVGEYVATYDHLPHWAIVLILTSIMLFMTELMSNVALTTIMVPMVIGIANGLGIDPFLVCIPVTMAASCAFMMPISTPPNAVVFSSGYIKMKEMVRAGFLLNLLSILILVLIGLSLVKWVLA